MAQSKQLVNQPAAQPERDFVKLSPAVDIYENENEVLLVADMPGVGANDASVRLEPPRLLVEGRAIARPGLRPVLYERAFRVGEDIEQAGISAELEAGVLRLHLKKSEASKPRRIEVKAGR